MVKWSLRLSNAARYVLPILNGLAHNAG